MTRARAEAKKNIRSVMGDNDKEKGKTVRSRQKLKVARMRKEAKMG